MGKLIIGANGQELAPGIVKIAYHTPAGTLDISSNGVYDVAQYSLADVQVPQPTGTYTVESNGIYDITGYEFVDVQVPSAPQYYIEKIISDGKFISGPHLMDLSSITSFDAYSMAYSYYWSNVTGTVNLSSAINIEEGAFYQAFYQTNITSVNLHNLSSVTTWNAFYGAFQNCFSIQSVDLTSLTTISGGYGCYWMFAGCQGLTTVDLSHITSISGEATCQRMFFNCTGLTGKIDLSSLTTMNGTIGYGVCNGMFEWCNNITEVDLSNLEEILGSDANNMFSNCRSLSSVDLSSLRTVYSMGGAFSQCLSLTSLSFPSLTSTGLIHPYHQEFTNMLSDVTGCTVHFPSNLQSTMSSWSDVINGFGGTNTIVLFDLPATS